MVAPLLVQVVTIFEKLKIQKQKNKIKFLSILIDLEQIKNKWQFKSFQEAIKMVCRFHYRQDWQL